MAIFLLTVNCFMVDKTVTRALGMNVFHFSMIDFNDHCMMEIKTTRLL